MRRTGIVRDDRYLEHKTGIHHVEVPQRLETVYNMLDSNGLVQKLTIIPPRMATLEQIEMVHAPGYIEKILNTAGEPLRYLDPDTVTSERTCEAAFLAAGGVLEAVRLVVAGELDNAFALVRPPGHHAERSRQMGFCIFNNAALAAEYARRQFGLQRILIVDWDVHHPNGTQHIFEQTPEVLLFSTHRFPFFPGTGSHDEIGLGSGAGFTINVPLSARKGDRDFAAIYRRLLVPVALEYQPQLIIVSAGFDCHRDDPIGGMAVTEHGFAGLAGQVCALAEQCCAGHAVFVLEGGYDLGAMRTSVRSVLQAMQAEEHRIAADDRPQCQSFSWQQVDREFSWHATGRLNIAHEAIDRHALDPRCAERTCLINASLGREDRLTYAQMRRLSNRFGNALRGLGIGPGDRVCLLLPKATELYIALVACAKIGAIIVPLYSHLGAEAVRERLLDSRAKALLTDGALRTLVPAEELPDLEHIILAGGGPGPAGGHELAWDAVLQGASEDLEPAWLDAAAPLLLIYTSGPDGHPVGLLHAHDAMRGYLLTARWALDLKAGDVLWTHARSGWLMNIVYSAFAPWLCGATSFVTDQAHSAEQIYGHIARHRVSVLYVTPRKYRLLVEAGEDAARRFDLTSIRHLLSVLEQLSPDVIYAVLRILGVPIYDTWWTAETGMITIANFPCLPIKPGYLGKPFPGVRTAVLDAEGRPAPPFTMGEVALRPGWPAMVRGVWGNEPLYQRYFERPPWFMTGDTAFVDQDGYFFYQGRADDVIITSAGRVHIAEIEKTLARHPAVAAAGVIRAPSIERARRIKAYVALKEGYQPSPLLRDKILSYVKNALSPDLVPWSIEFCDSLPKSRSGAVLRRVLKAWDLGLPAGSISALADE